MLATAAAADSEEERTKRRRIQRLPDELVAFEILLRLRTKDLHLCKSVSKSWCSTICNAGFIKAYRDRKPYGGLLISVLERGDREKDNDGNFFSAATAAATEKNSFYYSPLRRQERVPGRRRQQLHRPEQFFPLFSVPSCDFNHGVTQVVNGLICFYDRIRVFVSNICTGQVRELPNNGFQANVTVIKYFLGFDPVDSVYKLLKISTFYEGLFSYRRGEIITLGRDPSWRDLDAVYAPLNSSDTQSFLVNGVLYWMYGRDSLDDCRYFLLSFDLHEEKFHRVKLPTVEPGLLLTQFRGRFALSAFDHCIGLSLYSLEDEFGNSWTEHRIKLPEELRSKHAAHSFPVGNLPSGQILLAIPSDKPFTPVYSYDHNSNKFERFVVGNFPPSLDLRNRAHCAASISCLVENDATFDVLFCKSQ